PLGTQVFKLACKLPFLRFEREQRRRLLPEVELEAADRVAFLADFGKLTGRFCLELLDAHFEPARGHREFGAQPVLVGLNFGERKRTERLQAPRGQTNRARMHEGKDTKDEQTRDKKSDRYVHDRFEHGKCLLNKIDVFRHNATKRGSSPAAWAVNLNRGGGPPRCRLGGQAGGGEP